MNPALMPTLKLYKVPDYIHGGNVPQVCALCAWAGQHMVSKPLPECIMEYVPE